MSELVKVIFKTPNIGRCSFDKFKKCVLCGGGDINNLEIKRMDNHPTLNSVIRIQFYKVKSVDSHCTGPCLFNKVDIIYNKNKLKKKKIIMEQINIALKNYDEKRNMINFKKLLPNFFFSEDTYKNLIKSLDKKTSNKIFWELDNFLKLKKDRRIWYKLPKDSTTTDLGYENYKDIMKRIYNNDQNNPIYYKRDMFTLLTEYSTYRNNSFNLDNQKYKLFKYLLSNKILNKEEIESITSMRSSNKSKYLCISRNPIDYLMCSTGQSFTSCESLMSQYNAFYLGLGGLALDPNRCIIFISDGIPHKITIKRKVFSYYKYIQRSWGLWITNEHEWGNEQGIVIVRNYPSQHISLSKQLNNIGIQSIDHKQYYDTYSHNIRSVHSFKLPGDKEGNISFLYLDYIGLYVENNKVRYTKWNTSYSNSMISYRTNRLFSEVNTYDDLNTSLTRCRECGGVLKHKTDNYCENCKKRIFKKCAICNRSYHRHYLHNVIPNTLMCERCLKENSVKCNWCGRRFLSNNSVKRIMWYEEAPYTKLISDNYHICNDCLRPTQESYRYTFYCRACHNLCFASTTSHLFKQKLCHVHAKSDVKKKKVIKIADDDYQIINIDSI